jgi:hypothetical protein
MTDERRRDPRDNDATVDAAWRKASRDEPPPHVDTAILAAARAEARGRAPAGKPAARQPWWVSWQPVAAAAGVIGIAFVLVQLIPREETTHAPAPAPVPAAATAKQPPAQRNKVAPSAPVQAPVVAAPTPAPAVTDKSVAARESMSGDVMSAETAERPAPAGPAAGASAPSAAAPMPPEAWARHIAALHASGDVAAAASELSAFRTAYPDADAYLPVPMRPWAASVPAADSP